MPAVFIALLVLFVVCANAHPGKTDGSGGHYNRSTGEYHYHHGYSAHDHYDMDGDGDLDCPYNFKNKTNQQSTAVKSSKKYSPNAFGKICLLIFLIVPATFFIVMAIVGAVNNVLTFFNIEMSDKCIGIMVWTLYSLIIVFSIYSLIIW